MGARGINLITREQIIERLCTENVNVGFANDFFSSDIEESLMRFVIGIFINGDGVATRFITISKVEEDNTLTAKFTGIPVSPVDTRNLPPSGFDIENPFLVLEGGTNLRGSVVGATLDLTVVFWDNATKE